MRELKRAGAFWLYSDALLKLTGVFVTVFAVLMMWLLYRYLQWFAAGMGLL